MLDNHLERLDAATVRLQLLVDAYGKDPRTWPPEAQAEAWQLHRDAPSAIADALAILRRYCPDC
jgi:hypothetical protein